MGDQSALSGPLDPIGGPLPQRVDALGHRRQAIALSMPEEGTDLVNGRHVANSILEREEREGRRERPAPARPFP